MRRYPHSRSRSILPTADEINDGSIDGPYAEQHFLGKTPGDVQAMFPSNPLTYMDDYYHMGVTAFCFYLPAAIDYLLSPAADHEYNVLSSFAGMMMLRLDRERGEMTAVLPVVRHAVDAFLADLDRFFDRAATWHDEPNRKGKTDRGELRAKLEQLSVQIGPIKAKRRT